MWQADFAIAPEAVRYQRIDDVLQLRWDFTALLYARLGDHTVILNTPAHGRISPACHYQHYWKTDYQQLWDRRLTLGPPLYTNYILIVTLTNLTHVDFGTYDVDVTVTIDGVPFNFTFSTNVVSTGQYRPSNNRSFYLMEMPYISKWTRISKSFFFTTNSTWSALKIYGLLVIGLSYNKLQMYNRWKPTVHCPVAYLALGHWAMPSPRPPLRCQNMIGI